MHFIEKFITAGVKKSVRNLYLEMIAAACTYLLEKYNEYHDLNSTTQTILLKEGDAIDDCYHNKNDNKAIFK